MSGPDSEANKPSEPEMIDHPLFGRVRKFVPPVGSIPPTVPVRREEFLADILRKSTLGFLDSTDPYVPSEDEEIKIRRALYEALAADRRGEQASNEGDSDTDFSPVFKEDDFNPFQKLDRLYPYDPQEEQLRRYMRETFGRAERIRRKLTQDPENTTAEPVDLFTDPFVAKAYPPVDPNEIKRGSERYIDWVFKKII